MVTLNRLAMSERIQRLIDDARTLAVAYARDAPGASGVSACNDLFEIARNAQEAANQLRDEAAAEAPVDVLLTPELFRVLVADSVANDYQCILCLAKILDDAGAGGHNLACPIGLGVAQGWKAQEGEADADKS